MDDDMLTTRDVSREYRLTESSLEKWRVAGVGPAYLKLSRRVMYRRSDVEQWLADNRRSSTSDPGLPKGTARERETAEVSTCCKPSHEKRRSTVMDVLAEPVSGKKQWPHR